MNVFRVAKAVVGAALGAAAMAYGSAASDGVITQQEWAQIVGAAVVVGFGVWVTPNLPRKVA